MRSRAGFCLTPYVWRLVQTSERRATAAPGPLRIPRRSTPSQVFSGVVPLAAAPHTWPSVRRFRARPLHTCARVQSRHGARSHRCAVTHFGPISLAILAVRSVVGGSSGPALRTPNSTLAQVWNGAAGSWNPQCTARFPDKTKSQRWFSDGLECGRSFAAGIPHTWPSVRRFRGRRNSTPCKVWNCGQGHVGRGWRIAFLRWSGIMRGKFF